MVKVDRYAIFVKKATQKETAETGPTDSELPIPLDAIPKPLYAYPLSSAKKRRMRLAKERRPELATNQTPQPEGGDKKKSIILQLVSDLNERDQRIANLTEERDALKKDLEEVIIEKQMLEEENTKLVETKTALQAKLDELKRAEDELTPEERAALAGRGYSVD